MRRKLELVFIVTIISINIYFFSFDWGLMLKWNVYVPNFNNISYTKLNEPGFKIMVKRYSILQYKSKFKKRLISYNNWKKFDLEKYEDDLDNIDSILNWLDVPTDKRPNYKEDFRYIFKRGEDNANLFLLYSEENGVIYIIEES